jgi:hypothetical protein
LEHKQNAAGTIRRRKRQTRGAYLGVVVEVVDDEELVVVVVFLVVLWWWAAVPFL